MAGEVPVLVRQARRAPSGNRWWPWSCGGVGVGAGRACGPPVGFRRLAAVAELADVGAFACVWLLMQSASLLGGGGLAVCAGRRVVMVRRAGAVGGLVAGQTARPPHRRPLGGAGVLAVGPGVGEVALVLGQGDPPLDRSRAVLVPRLAGRPLRGGYP